MLEVWFFIVLYSPHSRQNMTKPPTLQGFRQDTAEYGLGMALGSQQRRERLVADVKELLEEAGHW